MSFFIILFIISLLGIGFLLGRKAWQLDAGAYDEYEETPRSLIPDVTLAKIGTTSVEYAKRGGHLIIMGTIKVWVIVTHLGSKKIREKLPNILNITKQKLSQSELLQKSKRVVNHYKHRANKLREKLKHEDKKVETVTIIEEPTVESVEIIEEENQG